MLPNSTRTIHRAVSSTAVTVASILLLTGSPAPVAGIGDGYLDTTFGVNGSRSVAWDAGGALADRVGDVAADDDGNLYLVGSYDSVFGDDDWGVTKLDADGTPIDSAYLYFDLGGFNTDLPTGVLLDRAGGLLIAGQARAASAVEIRLCRLWTSDLSLDLGFANGNGCATYAYGSVPLYATALARAADGGYLVAGSYDWGGGDSDFFVVKFTAAGLLDTTFNMFDLFHPGMAVVAIDRVAGGADSARSIAVDHLGRILVAGDAEGPAVSNEAAVIRLSAGGVLDSSFGSSGHLGWTYFDGLVDHPTWGMTVAVDPIADTFLIGYSWSMSNGNGAAVGHFDASGAWQNFPGAGSPIREVTWEPGGSNWIRKLLFQCDGRILAVGDSYFGGIYRATRLFANGTVDGSYNVAGVASFSPFANGLGSGLDVAAATLASGRLVFAGTVLNANEDWLAVRMTSELMFCDNLETGTTARWSSSVPN